MRFKLTILLLLLNVALFLTLFYMDKSAASARAFDAQNSLVIQSGSMEQADLLELDGPGAPSHWLIQRQNADWRMVRPQQWPVNAYAVQNILDQIRFLRMETRFPVEDIENSGMTLADYGLDNPSVTLRIGVGTKNTLLRIGAPTKIGARLYVLSADGKDVFVTSRDVLRALLVNIDDLRDSRIFTIPSYMVSSISMQRADGARVRLTKLGIGWEFESPIRVDADGESIESFLSDMAGLKVKAFVPPDTAAQGLLSPRLRVGIDTDDQRQSLLLGSDAGEGLIYAKLENSPEVFTMDASIIERAQQAQEALRQRHFNRINKAALGEVRISMGTQTATLQKLETGEWQVLRQNSAEGVQTWKADPDVIKDLIETLDSLYALRFVSDAPSESDLESYGFKNPQREISLQFTKSKSALVLGDLEPKLHGAYIKNADDPFVYEVSDSLIEKLNPSPLHFRTRELETLPATAKILRLRLTRVSDSKTVLDIAQQEGQNWEQTLAGKTAEEVIAANALLAYVRSAHAVDFLSATFEDPLTIGDDKSLAWVWQLSADIALPSGTTQSATRTLSYMFTDAIGGTTQFGGSRELNLTFKIPQTLIDALRQFTFDHSKPAEQTIPPLPITDKVVAPQPDVPLQETQESATPAAN